VTEASAPKRRLKVVVAAATYRRPELLRSLLPALAAQAASLEHDCWVVIVDNDPEESGRSVAASWAQRGVEYVPEPRPGIAAARNRALLSAAGADVVVFVDDDETPDPHWLESLVDAWLEWGCAAVAGPVISSFSGPVAAWVEACSTFRRPRLASGTIVGGAATNNLLLDLSVLARLDLRFDDRFGLTGGSDTMLTHTLVRRGQVIRWCDEAVMRETVPAERATREWVLRRSERTGNVWSRVKVSLAETSRERALVRVRLILRALALRSLAGAVRTLLGTARHDLALRSKGEIDMAQGRGVLRGAFGHVVVEYQRSKG